MAKNDQKKGAPKYAGISEDVYENKGPGKAHSGKSDDVIEKKHVMASIRRCL